MEKVIVNCEAHAITALLAEAAEWEAKGDPARAERVRQEAAAALEASGVEDPEAEAHMVVPFTDAERKQREKDERDHAKQEKERQGVETEREYLRERLKSGQASFEEVQQALASLL